MASHLALLWLREKRAAHRAGGCWAPKWVQRVRWLQGPLSFRLRRDPAPHPTIFFPPFPPRGLVDRPPNANARPLPIPTASQEFVRRYCGYVEQFDTLIPILTVREMLLYTVGGRMGCTHSRLKINFKSSQESPQLHDKAQASPQLHLSPQASPQLHLSPQASPQLHLSPQASPQLHLIKFRSTSTEKSGRSVGRSCGLIQPPHPQHPVMCEGRPCRAAGRAASPPPPPPHKH
jgi:hypothetical protein